METFLWVMTIISALFTIVLFAFLLPKIKDIDIEQLSYFLVGFVICCTFPTLFLNKVLELKLNIFEMAAGSFFIVSWLILIILVTIKAEKDFIEFLMQLLICQPFIGAPVYILLRIIYREVDWYQFAFIWLTITGLLSAYYFGIDFSTQEYYGNERKTMSRVKGIGIGASLVLGIIALILAINPSFSLKIFPNDVRALKNKISILKEMAVDLGEKQAEIDALRQSYLHQISQLKEEVRAEKSHSKVRNHDQAMANEMIAYNIKLIQKHTAYINRIEKVNSNLTSGILELVYLVRDAEADLGMVKALGKEEVKDLTERINYAIEEYEPEAGKFAVVVSEEDIPTTQQVWNQL